ncbi:MAG: type II toxin-antitoxin system prevent-host-death family antitoxin [Chloroflexi bacterium]|nr:type II toxin-antitoxin system prevent-host-death family antitoxin [Chloroflexota bacterium]
MRTITFTEFRRNASGIFSAVEEGEIIHIIRHGKKIAQILPISPDVEAQPSWKKKRMKLSIKGKRLSEMILDERESFS